MVSALRIDGVRYLRGAVIGAWTRQPPGPVDPVAIEALVAALAAPRALGFVDAPVAAVHRITLTITPPAGVAMERVLALGAPRAGGCPARISGTESASATGDALLLSATVCAQVAALAR